MYIFFIVLYNKRKEMPRKLRTIDLFSGCGGMALGLSKFAKTVAYCDCDEAARATLKRNMKKGKLDKAPVFEDVRTFPKLKTKVDLVTMGFPCQDLSTAGKIEGFRGKRSKLFYAGMEVVRKHKPRFVMLENVPNIVNVKNTWKPVLKTLHAGGYNAKWCMVSAEDCGAPHLRKRWFLLATKRGTGSLSGGGVRMADMTEGSKWNKRGWGKFRRNGWEVNVPRMVKTLGKAGQERIKQCGNICVPRSAEMAFRVLRGGVVGVKPSLIKFGGGGQMPHWGQMVSDKSGKMRILSTPVVRFPKPKSLGLVLVPKLKPGCKTFACGKAKSQTTPSVTEPYPTTRWNTPRKMSFAGAARTLTRRCKNDLQTMMRFERHTKQGHTKSYINPDYLDWMCGMPKGWTKA